MVSLCSWRGRPQADKADNPAEQLRPVRENGERTTVCRLQGSRPLTLPQPSTRDREARGLLNGAGKAVARAA